MFKTLTASAAALALCLNAAAAAPFAATVPSGETDQAKSENRGVIGYFVDQVAIFVGFEAGHDSADETKKYRIRIEGKCNEATAAESETADVDAEESAAAEPTGPEPIYYGF